MLYKDFETDEQGKLIKCPRCKNEHSSESEFCSKCGLPLYNKCIDSYMYHRRLNFIKLSCSSRCDVNAKYCPKCGSKTILHYLRTFQSWDQCDNELTEKDE